MNVTTDNLTPEQIVFILGSIQACLATAAGPDRAAMAWLATLSSGMVSDMIVSTITWRPW